MIRAEFQKIHDKIRAVRKEINILFNEYQNKINILQEEHKKIEFEAIMGSAEAWEKSSKLSSELKKLRISKYSLENADEFMAESFVACRFNSNNEYANKAYDIINKYFRR